MNEQKTIDQLTDLELAIFVQQQYESIIRAQSLIINAERIIQNRIKIQQKPDENAASNKEK